MSSSQGRKGGRKDGREEGRKGERKDGREEGRKEGTVKTDGVNLTQKDDKKVKVIK